ncbi:MAG: YfhO family protein [Chloroflexota bacterium]|nr:YfhO family protein [Chloroflexota bacterium]
MRGVLDRGAPRRVPHWLGAPLLVVALLTAGLLLSYRRLIFEGLVVAGYDTQTYFYPYWSVAFDALRSGRIPLWNPDLFMGAPFLANPQAAVFYLPNWLLLGLSPERAISVALILHVAWAAAGTAALTRVALRLGWASAAAGGAVFAFGGYFVAQSGHVNQVSATAWLPWLLLALDRAVAGNRRAWLALPLITALMLLAGHPQVAYMSLVFGLVYAMTVGATESGAMWRGRIRGAMRGLLAWAAAGAGGVLLAAVQVLPTLELSHHGIRSGGLPLYEAASFSLPGEEFLRAVLPTFTTLPSSTEFVAHIGLSGIILAVLGVAARPGRAPTLLFVATLAATLLLAAGPATPLFTLAHRLVPGFDLFRVPPRWLLLGLLAAALLVAQGVESLGRGRVALGEWRRGTGAGLGLIAVGLALAVAGALHPVSDDVTRPWMVAGLLALALLAAAYASPWAWARWAAAVLVVAELVVASGPAPVGQAVPAEAYAADASVKAALRADGWNGRVLSLAKPSFEISQPARTVIAETWFHRLGERSFRELLVTLKNSAIMNPNLGMAYRLATADGYDGGVLPLRSYVEFRDLLLPGTGATPDLLIQQAITDIPSDRVLDGLGVRSVIRSPDRMHDVAGATLDLGYWRRIDARGRSDELFAAAVVGAAAVIDAPPDGPAGPAGRVELHAADGRTVTLPLRRHAERPERVVLGPGHLVAVRRGLDRPAFMSQVTLDEEVDVTRVTVVAEGLPFDLRALTLLHADGGSTAVALRSEAAALSARAGEVVVTRRGAPIARAWLVSDVRLARDEVEARDLVGGFGFASDQTVVLTVADDIEPRWGAPGEAARATGLLRPSASAGRVDAASAAELRALIAAGSEAEPGGDSVESLMEAPERVRLRVRASGARVLVLPDAPYPGWRAQVNGVEQPVWRANLGHRAVLIPAAGEHLVEFTYRSVPFEVGRMVSLVSLGALCLGAAVVWVRGRRL